MKEVKLPSGSVLKIGTIPFDVANELKKEVMRKIEGIAIESTRQLLDICKDYLCTLIASNEVEKALWECMRRCVYNSGQGDLKIDQETFQKMETWEDFTQVQAAVMEHCLTPFSKGLFALLQRMLAIGAVNIPQST